MNVPCKYKFGSRLNTIYGENGILCGIVIYPDFLIYEVAYADDNDNEVILTLEEHDEMEFVGMDYSHSVVQNAEKVNSLIFTECQNGFRLNIKPRHEFGENISYMASNGNMEGEVASIDIASDGSTSYSVWVDKKTVQPGVIPLY